MIQPFLNQPVWRSCFSSHLMSWTFIPDLRIQLELLCWVYWLGVVQLSPWNLWHLGTPANPSMTFKKKMQPGWLWFFFRWHLRKTSTKVCKSKLFGEENFFTKLVAKELFPKKVWDFFSSCFSILAWTANPGNLAWQKRGAQNLPWISRVPCQPFHPMVRPLATQA